ncbi:MAG TPA: hypothetical protein VLH19_03355 [Patescibacteria group bacterium]|nr:hypothetical protein [Patescibacteria group bacterium]
MRALTPEATENFAILTSDEVLAPFTSEVAMKYELDKHLKAGFVKRLNEEEVSE